MANLQIKVGQKDTLTFAGLSNESNPWSNWTLQFPPAISQPGVFTVGGNDKSNASLSCVGGAGSTGVTVTWTGVDNNDNTKTATLVDTYDILAATEFLQSISDTHSIA